MWRLVLIAAIIHIAGVRCRPSESMERSPWYEDSSPEEFHRYQRESENNLEQRYPFLDSYKTDEEDYDLIYPRLPVDKRAFAMLARWGAINNVGKQRSPIREAGISAEPRGGVFRQEQKSLRPVGQPLRWG